MRKFLLALVATLITSTASAAEPTLEQIITQCKAQYTSESAIAQCVTDIRFAQAETELEVVLGEIERLRDSVDALADAGTMPSSEPEQVATVQTGAIQQGSYSPGVAWRFVPDHDAVSINNIGALEEYPDTLRVTHLRGDSSRQRCGGVGSTYLVITEDGYPITNVWGAGFHEIYWDANSDGQPDQGVGMDRNGDGIGDGVVLALDLSTQDDVYMTWGLSEFGSPEDMRIVYVRANPRRVEIPGYGYVSVYHPTTSRESATGVIACRRDVLATPGGHQTIRADQLAKVRH
jgi:hypothetical protein